MAISESFERSIILKWVDATGLVSDFTFSIPNVVKLGSKIIDYDDSKSRYPVDDLCANLSSIFSSRFPDSAVTIKTIFEEISRDIKTSHIGGIPERLSGPLPKTELLSVSSDSKRLTQSHPPLDTENENEKRRCLVSLCGYLLTLWRKEFPDLFNSLDKAFRTELDWITSNCWRNLVPTESSPRLNASQGAIWRISAVPIDQISNKRFESEPGSRVTFTFAGSKGDRISMPPNTKNSDLDFFQTECERLDSDLSACLGSNKILRSKLAKVTNELNKTREYVEEQGNDSLGKTTDKKKTEKTPCVPVPVHDKITSELNAIISSLQRDAKESTSTIDILKEKVFKLQVVENSQIHMKARCKQLETEIQDMRIEHSSLLAVIDSHDKQKKQYALMIEKLTESELLLETMRVEKQMAEATSSHLSRQLGEMKAANAGLNLELRRWQSEKSGSSIDSVAELEATVMSLRVENATLKNAVENVVDQRLEQAAAKERSLGSMVTRAETISASMKVAMNDMRDQLQTSERARRTAEIEVERLKEGVNSESQKESAGQIEKMKLRVQTLTAESTKLQAKATELTEENYQTGARVMALEKEISDFKILHKKKLRGAKESYDELFCVLEKERVESQNRLDELRSFYDADIAKADQKIDYLNLALKTINEEKDKEIESLRVHVQNSASAELLNKKLGTRLAESEVARSRCGSQIDVYKRELEESKKLLKILESDRAEWRLKTENAEDMHGESKIREEVLKNDLRKARQEVDKWESLYNRSLIQNKKLVNENKSMDAEFKSIVRQHTPDSLDDLMNEHEQLKTYTSIINNTKLTEQEKVQQLDTETAMGARLLKALTTIVKNNLELEKQLSEYKKNGSSKSKSTTDSDSLETELEKTKAALRQKDQEIADRTMQLHQLKVDYEMLMSNLSRNVKSQDSTSAENCTSESQYEKSDNLNCSETASSASQEV